MKVVIGYIGLLLLMTMTSMGQANEESGDLLSNLPQELTELMKHEPVSLESGELRMRFFPEAAWTFKEIKIGGKELTQFRSLTGMVISLDVPGRWLGTGHREAGTEQVQKVTLTVDGREVDPLQGGHFSGEVVELTKESTLANALALKTVFRLDRGTFVTEHTVEVYRDIDLLMAYAFMYPWSEETSGWMAKLVDGEVIEGGFDEQRTWELRKDVEWTAIYHPQAGVAAWVEFDENSRQGAGIRHGIWNVKNRYHKQYYQPWGRVSLQAGQQFEWRAVARFLSVGEEQWKEAVLESVQP